MWMIKYLVALVFFCCQTTGISSNSLLRIPDVKIPNYPHRLMDVKIGRRKSQIKPSINERPPICNCSSSLESSTVHQGSIHFSILRKPEPTLPTLNLNGSLYYFELEKTKDFFGAFQFCRQNEMQLLSIETPAEDLIITNYIKERANQIDHFWTSGNDLSVKGNFFWLSTGAPVLKKLNYLQGDLGDKHCFGIEDFGGDNYQWNAMNCTLSLNFICEW